MSTKKIKEPIIHLDIIGRWIQVGDYVAAINCGALHVAKVTKMTPKMVKVKILNAGINNWYSGEHFRYAADLAVIDGQYLTMHLIRNSE